MPLAIAIVATDVWAALVTWRLAHYDAISGGSQFGVMAGWPFDQQPLPDAAPIRSVDTHMLGSEYVVDAKPGGRFVVALTLVNTGDRDVRVVDLPLRRHYYFRATDVRIGAAEAYARVPNSDMVPFRPFTLRAGTNYERHIAFEYRFIDDCDLEDGASGFYDQRVVVEVEGFTRTLSVELSSPVALKGVSGSCENPMNRGADGVSVDWESVGD